MRPLYLPGQDAGERQNSASQGVGDGRAAQSPGWRPPLEREARQPSNSTDARPDAVIFPSDGTLVRPSGRGGPYASAQVSRGPAAGRGNGAAATPSVAEAATLAAEVLSSSQTGEIMVQADFQDSGTLAPCVLLVMCVAANALLGR
jgi:hypothetical protein